MHSGLAISRSATRPSGTTSRVQRLLSAMLYGRCSIATTPTEMDRIYALRYRIYIEELHKALPWADHAQKRLPDPYDDGATHFTVSRLGGSLVGCVRLHLGHSIPTTILEAMQIAAFVAEDGYRCGYVSKLMVDRSLRGKGASLAMMMRMIEYGAAAGGEYALFHCKPKLASLYERFGFRRIGPPFPLPHVGDQVPMINLFGDADHFAAVGSPLAQFVKPFRLPKERLDFLRASLLSQVHA